MKSFFISIAAAISSLFGIPHQLVNPQPISLPASVTAAPQPLVIATGQTTQTTQTTQATQTAQTAPTTLTIQINSQSPTDISAAISSTISTTSWKTYIDDKNGYQIQYPSDFNPPVAQGPDNISGPSIDLYVPRAYAPASSDFNGAAIGVSIVSAETCTPARFDTTYMYTPADRDPSFVKMQMQPLTSNGLTFQGVTAVGKGDRTDTYYLYAIGHGSQCYGIFMHTYNGWYTSGSGLTSFDPVSFLPLFYRMISTFSFTDSGNAGISLKYPKGGETVYNDPTYGTPLANIIWDYRNAGALGVDIDLEDQNGSLIKNMAENIPNTGNYFWNSDPSLSKAMYRIKVSYPAKGMPLASSESEPFLITPALKTQHPVSGPQTYTNTQFGFSFDYPQDFIASSTMSTGNNVTLGTSTAIILIPNNDYFPHFSLHGNTIVTGSAEISVNVSDNVSNCPSGYSPSVYDDTRSFKQSPVPSVSGTWTKIIYPGDAAMQHSYGHTSYFLVRNGKCYSVNYSTVYVNSDAYADDSAQAQDIRQQLENNSPLDLDAAVMHLVTTFSVK